MLIHKIILAALFFPLMLSAQQFRIGNPALGTPCDSGWQVDPGTGALAISIPVGSVPGEVPIPVALTMNGSCTSYGVQSDFEKTFGMYGTVGLGYIGYSEGPGNLVVLENGRNLSDRDFTSAGGYGSSLLAAYGVTGTPSSRLVSSDGSLLWVTYAANALPANLQSLITLATGFPTGVTCSPSPWRPNVLTGGMFDILADKNLLRVYQEVFLANGEIIAVPVLWADRFNHHVKLTWVVSTVNLPTGIQAIVKVRAMNDHGQGVDIRWMEGSTDMYGPVLQDLVRVDFEGCTGPSLSVSGWPGFGLNPNALAGMGYASSYINIGGMVGVPVTVKIGPSGLFRSLPGTIWPGTQHPWGLAPSPPPGNLFRFGPSPTHPRPNPTITLKSNPSPTPWA